VFLTADHGEQFFEHGYLGHKFDLHVESLHVPLVVRLPGDERAARDDRLVSLVDLYPTILSLAGGRMAARAHGQSLLGPPRGPGDAVFHELRSTWFMRLRATGQAWEEQQDWIAMRAGDETVIWRQERQRGARPAIAAPPDDEAELLALYDARADPGELAPLTAGAQRVARTRARLAEWQRAMRLLGSQTGARAPAALTPEEERRLRSLGYLAQP